MLNRILALSTISLVFSTCTSTTPRQPPQITSSSTAASGGVRITEEMMGRGRGTMVIARQATDPKYGFSEKASIAIGGGFDEGLDRTFRFLNSLLGPNGEAVSYDRVGTCCSFKTGKSPFGEGLLEVYEIKVANAPDAQRLYFNWYDQDEVFVPVGLTAVH